MLENLLNFFNQYASSYGLVTIFAIAFFENSIFLGAIVPGETMALLSGYYASEGLIPWLPAILLLTFGAILGDNLGFAIGKWKGKKWLTKIGPRFGYREEKIERSEDFWQDHGTKAVFWGRFIAVVRSFMPFLAGSSKMKRTDFIKYDLAGSVLWSVIHFSLGYFFGSNLKFIKKTIGEVGIILLIIFVIIVYRYLVRKGIERIEGEK